MPLVSIPDTELRASTADYKDQLKCRNANGDKIELLDAGRLDLFSITGIRRQIDLLRGDTREVPDYASIAMTKFDDAPHKPTAAVTTSEEQGFSELFTDEFITNVSHYFGRTIHLCLKGNCLTIDSDEPFLTSAFLRVMIADFFDAQLMSQVRIEASSDVIHNLRACPKTCFLKRCAIQSHLGIELNNDEIIEALAAYGYTNVRAGETDITANAPVFRIDVTSSSDVLEDICNFNIHKMKPGKTVTVPQYRSDAAPYKTQDVEFGRRIALQGYKEVRLPSLLTCAETLDPGSIGMLVDDQKGNPRLTYRQSLFHSLIDYERGRQHIRLPHRIFEIGLVSAMEGFRTHLALIAVDQKLDINELYFVLYHAMDVTYDQRISLAHGSDNRFEDGGFEIISCDGQVMGILGVVSKDVAKTYRQRFKTGFAELSLPNT